MHVLQIDKYTGLNNDKNCKENRFVQSNNDILNTETNRNPWGNPVTSLEEILLQAYEKSLAIHSVSKAIVHTF